MAFHLNPTPSRALLPPSKLSSPSKPSDLASSISRCGDEVKGNVDVIGCSNAKVGIGTDEVSPKASSTSIPSSTSLMKKELTGTKTKSLPSSPTKACSCRSIDELRAEILLMKNLSFGRLKPVAAEDENKVLKASPAKGIVSQAIGGPQMAIHEAVAPMAVFPVSGASTRKGGMFPVHLAHNTDFGLPLLKMEHDKPCSPSAPNHSSFYPVKALVQGGSQTSPSSPIPIMSATNTQPNKENQHPSGIDHASLPKSNNSNNCSQLATCSSLPNLETEFPPLNGTKPSHSPLETNQPLTGQNDQISPNANKQPDQKWAQLFASNRLRENGLSLEYIQPTQQESGLAVTFTEEEIADDKAQWDNSLVGYVLGQKPTFKQMKQFVEKRWKSFGSIELYILKAGVFVFKFENGEIKQSILEMGPWSYFDKPLLLKPWSPNSSYDREAINTIPIWIRLPHLKLHLWSAKSLSKIASAIGTPLFTDKMTATKQRLAYARICVEIEAGFTPPQEIKIDFSNGHEYFQKVEYEWLPSTCEHCKAFGHKTTSCIKHVRKEWRPKPKQQKEEQASDSQEESQLPSEEKIKIQPMPNKFDVLNQVDDVLALEISPLAIDNSMAQAKIVQPEIVSSPTELSIVPVNADIVLEPTQQVGNNEELCPSIAEAMNSPGAATIPLKDSSSGNLVTSSSKDQRKEKGNVITPTSADHEVDNWEVMLSKSQKKKQAKFMYALAQKDKASSTRNNRGMGSPGSHSS